ncbi:hypothetical protein P154DRAFT_579705 [Amniculicola lignicola CBS 123094]|uniref:Uncharacterized protein n=1 Tax=Amniculicola lignicola CBS 123094 TaxID=1392246 RepID=A0A6A5W411_9PLEO|nr:hypothetical protein P154DRAFT_579705 [Amniculicola lignicola CBS 123094]
MGPVPRCRYSCDRPAGDAFTLWQASRTHSHTGISPPRTLADPAQCHSQIDRLSAAPQTLPQHSHAAGRGLACLTTWIASLHPFASGQEVSSGKSPFQNNVDDGWALSQRPRENATQALGTHAARTSTWIQQREGLRRVFSRAKKLCQNAAHGGPALIQQPVTAWLCRQMSRCQAVVLGGRRSAVSPEWSTVPPRVLQWRGGARLASSEGWRYPRARTLGASTWVWPWGRVPMAAH